MSLVANIYPPVANTVKYDRVQGHPHDSQENSRIIFSAFLFVFPLWSYNSMILYSHPLKDSWSVHYKGSLIVPCKGFGEYHIKVGLLRPLTIQYARLQ